MTKDIVDVLRRISIYVGDDKHSLTEVLSYDDMQAVAQQIDQLYQQRERDMCAQMDKDLVEHAKTKQACLEAIEGCFTGMSIKGGLISKDDALEAIKNVSI